MKNNVKILFFLGLIFSFFLVPAGAEYNARGIPDSSEIRSKVSEIWFEAPCDTVRMLNSEIRVNSIGIPFQIRLEEKEKQFFIIVAPQTKINIDVYDRNGVHTEVEDAYPGDVAGSWLLVRDKISGKPVLIRYYFANNSEVYVQFRPASKDACFAELMMYGAYAAKGVPVGIPFERFYTMSFSHVQSITADTLPWKYTEGTPGLYDGVQTMVQTIRKNLPRLAYDEDAMYDEKGNPVSIETGRRRIIAEKYAGKLTLSSLGFMKWIADGIVEPLAGNYLKRVPLLVPTMEYRPTGFQGVLEQKNAISLGLDWTRNLAAAVMSVYNHRTYMYAESGVDVKIEPFASVLTDNGYENISGYVKNSGYRPQILQPLLYALAASEPDYFYFAAIRQTDMAKTEVKAFNQCAAIFPYFDEHGRFNAVVFMDGEELTLRNFLSAVSEDKNMFVHLSRAKSSIKFYPQKPSL